ncbi:hypothetical protein AAT19DRAFT_12276 [Rhodotorula toruloides]|uniref:Hypervirulence associated protein TUDOR domain-containing protein n=1 Tax=Rhodotorula toruloides TaxID=5286 RepID=A0A2T0AFS6_RHOTO|nr:hypothetical protein AAT19DRAFT_12276 [Rhodotorula toruloides]
MRSDDPRPRFARLTPVCSPRASPLLLGRRYLLLASPHLTAPSQDCSSTNATPGEGFSSIKRRKDIMTKPEDLKEGDRVSWNYGGGHPTGTVEAVVPEHDTIETKGGKEVSRKGTAEDPAVELKADSGNKAIKLAHELNEVDESSTGDKTSYAKEAAGGDAKTNKEAEEKTGDKDVGEDKSEERKEESEEKDEGKDDAKEAQRKGGQKGGKASGKSKAPAAKKQKTK